MTTETMTTGNITLVVIALLGIAIGVFAIWQYLGVRNLIEEYFRKSERQRQTLLNAINDAENHILESSRESRFCNRHPEYCLSLLDSDSTRGLRDCMEDLCKIYGIPAYLLVKGMQEAGVKLNLKSGTIFKSSLSPESATSKGTITPPLSLSDIELRKYCIEQTNKDQVYLRIEDAQRLYDYILNGNQRGKEVTNEH